MIVAGVDKHTIDTIAANHGVKVTYISDDPDFYKKQFGYDDFVNRSFIIGNDEIVLGIYEDRELLFISFFHELGHRLVEGVSPWNPLSKFRVELHCWDLALQEAQKHGIEFSDKTVGWGYSCALTYLKN